MPAYFRPATRDEALALLAPGSAPPGLAVVAGGTGHFSARPGRPPAPAILDITGIADLDGIVAEGAGWRIGATTRWSDILQHPGLPPAFDALRAAARGLGSVAIRNAATLAGNLCTAAADADGIPPLLAMDALVELQDLSGRSTMPLVRFIAGDRRTRLRPGQLMTAILLPGPAASPGTVRSGFLRLGGRRQLAPALASLAAVLHLTEGRIASAAIAAGACGPMARRLPALEARLAGRPLISESVTPGVLSPDLLSGEELAALAPADDHRAPAGYRRAILPVLLHRLLLDLAAPGTAGCAASGAGG